MSPNLRPKLLIPLFAIALLLALVAWMSGVFSTRIEPGFDQARQGKPDNLYQVRLQEVPLIEPVPASVEARDTTSISSRLLARINSIKVRAGDIVGAGQLLVELEQSDLTAIAQQARERIRAIEARATEAERTLERMARLQRDGAVSVADLDRARAARDALAADLDAARQALQEAETGVGFTKIRSPIDGRIVDRFAEPGDLASPGMTLLTLYNPLSLRVEAQVREELALTLGLGQRLTVIVPSLNQRRDAVVEEMVPAAEAGSRSFLVKARLDREESLLPGMYARLLIVAAKQKQILIPAESVVEVGQLNMVWAWQSGVLQRRIIKLGESQSENRVQVTAGLSPGDWIIPRAPDT